MLNNLLFLLENYSLTIFMTPFFSEFILFFYLVVLLLICVCIPQNIFSNLFFLRLSYNIFHKIIQFLILLNFLLLAYSNDFILTSYFYDSYIIQNFSILFFKGFLFFIFAILLGQIKLFFKRFYKYWQNIYLFFILIIASILSLSLLIASFNLYATFLILIAFNISFYTLLIKHFFYGMITCEGLLKYFIFSGSSTGFFFGGTRDIIAVCGTGDLNLINEKLISILIEYLEKNTCLDLFIIKYALMLLCFGFFFKLAIFPGHFWAPEVYESVSFTLLFYIILPLKVCMIFLFIRFIKFLFTVPITYDSPNLLLLGEFNGMLTLSIIISIILGSFYALFEQRLKRFIAYSSISQIGYLLVGFLGYGISLYSIQIIIYFLFTYVLNSILFLFIICFFCYRLNFSIFIDNENQINYIADLYSLFIRSLLLHKKVLRNLIGFVILIVYIFIIFSFAGIPPLFGFYGKLYILLYVIEQKNWFLVFICTIFSVIGVSYYLRLITVPFLTWFNSERPLTFIATYELFFINYFESYFYYKKVIKRSNNFWIFKDLQFWIILLILLVGALFICIQAWSIDFFLMNLFYYIALIIIFY